MIFESDCTTVTLLSALFFASTKWWIFYRQESARYRKYISKILNRLAQMKFQSTKPSVLILYGCRLRNTSMYKHSYKRIILNVKRKIIGTYSNLLQFLVFFQDDF